MRISRLERFAFLASAGFLLFLYGYGAAAFGWPPSGLLHQAVGQAKEYTGELRNLKDRVYTRSGVAVPYPEKIAGGLTLITTSSSESDWRPHALLLDAAGTVVHDWIVRPAGIFAGTESSRGLRLKDRGIHGSYVFPDGSLMVNIEHVGTVRVDACGDVLWRLANHAHHSIAPGDDGTFWIPRSTRAEVPRSEAYPDGFPGLDRPVNHDFLLRVTADGEVLDSISMLDVLYRNGLTRSLVESPPYPPSPPTDLLHLNDAEPLPDSIAAEYPAFERGDLLVSLRDGNIVFVMDPDTERVKWSVTEPFIQQHDADFIGNGWIGIFDNARDETPRGELLGGSRILAFKPGTDSIRVLFPGPQSDPFYSWILGKWQRLPNGNMLLTEGTAGRVVEVDSAGRTVWEWVHPGYDEAKTPEISEGTRYDLGVDNVAAWPCGRPRRVHSKGGES